MPEICAGKTPAPNDAIARSTRPTRFYNQSAYSVLQREYSSNHRRVTDFETMPVLMIHFKTTANTIKFSCDGRKARKQPLDAGSAQQIIRISQGQILDEISASRVTCTS